MGRSCRRSGDTASGRILNRVGRCKTGVRMAVAAVGRRLGWGAWRGGVRRETTSRRRRWACWILQSCPSELRKREGDGGWGLGLGLGKVEKEDHFVFVDC